MTDYHDLEARRVMRLAELEPYKPKRDRQTIDPVPEPARPDMLAELASIVRSLTYGEAMQLEAAVGGFDKLHKWANEDNAK